MKILFLVNLLLMGLVVGAMADERTNYFLKPKNTLCIKKGEFENISEILKSHGSDLCVHFEKSSSARLIIDVLQKIALERTHTWISLSDGENIYYGFYLTDLHKMHPWYDDSFKGNQLNVIVFHNLYICQGEGVSIEKMDRIIGSNRQQVVNIVLSEEALYSDLDTLLVLLRNNRVHTYFIQQNMYKKGTAH